MLSQFYQSVAFLRRNVSVKIFKKIMFRYSGVLVQLLESRNASAWCKYCLLDEIISVALPKLAH
jgi:hypothetical protein